MPDILNESGILRLTGVFSPGEHALGGARRGEKRPERAVLCRTAEPAPNRFFWSGTAQFLAVYRLTLLNAGLPEIRVKKYLYHKKKQWRIIKTFSAH